MSESGFVGGICDQGGSAYREGLGFPCFAALLRVVVHETNRPAPVAVEVRLVVLVFASKRDVSTSELLAEDERALHGLVDHVGRRNEGPLTSTGPLPRNSAGEAFISEKSEVVYGLACAVGFWTMFFGVGG